MSKVGKAAQRQFLVKVSGIEGYFATKSGGDTTADAVDVWDGGSLTPEKLSSPAVTSDVVVSRPYDNTRDGPIIRFMRVLVGRARSTITVQDTDADLIARGTPVTYANALLIGITVPEFDAASGDAATFEMTWAVARAS